MLTGFARPGRHMLCTRPWTSRKRGEYHELELLVKSITKLQPYFITPWLYQSWNISFNVAVECDRPRDKYYYISRGLELLAEGERRNQGVTTKREEGAVEQDRIVFPGHPELRHYMGFSISSRSAPVTSSLTIALADRDELHRIRSSGIAM